MTIDVQPTVRPIRPGDPALLLRLEQDGEHEISGTVTAGDVPRLLRDIANQLETKYRHAIGISAPASPAAVVADVLARYYDQTPIADLPEEFSAPHVIVTADILETLGYAHVSEFLIPSADGPLRVLRIGTQDQWAIFDVQYRTAYEPARRPLTEALQAARQLAADSIPAGDA